MLLAAPSGTAAARPRGLITAVLAAAAGVVICSPADHTGYFMHSDGLRAGTRAAGLGARPGVAVIIGGVIWPWCELSGGLRS